MEENVQKMDEEWKQKGKRMEMDVGGDAKTVRGVERWAKEDGWKEGRF